MEKLASHASSSPQDELRIFVKAKNASPHLVKEIKPNAVVTNDSIKKTISDSRVRPVSMKSRSKEFLNAISKEELKKRWEARFSRNTVTNWGAPRNPYLHKKESNIGKHLIPFAFSVCGAVLVGLVMGLSILSLFFSNHTNESGTTIDSHLPKTKVQNQVVSLPSLRIVMLQAGIFAEQEGAQKAIDQLRARGIGAVMSDVSPFRVFLGLAPSDEEAGKLASVYKKENVEVYQKELNIAEKVALAPNHKKLEPVIKKGNDLIIELSKRSSEAILTGTSVLVDSSMSQIDQQFNREVQAVLPFLSVEGREKLAEMKTALNQAVQSVKSIQSTPSQSTLWKVQEELVRYVTAYEKFISILSVK